MAAGFGSTRVRWMAGAAAALAYAAASHLLMTSAQSSPWSLAIVLGPLAVMGIAALWRSRQRVLALLCAGAALVVIVEASSGRAIPSRLLYLAQHAGVHLALACWFGATLRRGAEPLISMLARKVHRTFTPAMASYTRHVTLAWTLYFLVIAGASVTLFVAGDFARWSLLANLVTPLSTAGMFVGEYLVRYRLHPEFERVGLHQAWRAYQSRPAVALDSSRAALDP